MQAVKITKENQDHILTNPDYQKSFQNPIGLYALDDDKGNLILWVSPLFHTLFVFTEPEVPDEFTPVRRR